MTNYLFQNPDSGPEDHPDWSALLDAAGVEIEAVVHGFDELERVSPAEGDRLAVAGGDGTLHRVARVAIERGWVLGLLPAGTANDLARGLGVPLDPAAACRVIAHGRTRSVDVGWINDDVLLNAAQLGLGPEVASAAERGHKSRWGRFGYLRSLLERLSGRRGFRADIEADDERDGGYWLNVTVANGPCFGGGHSLDPEPDIEDGELDVIALRSRPLHRLLWAWLMRRIGFGYPEAVRHWRAQTVRIASDEARSVTLDGDPCTQTPLEATVRPGALRVLVPSRSSGC
jgi:YegS/Rv2252/BmrU family lipid kinase